MESTGDIIFFGKEHPADPGALHFYKYKNGLQKIGTKLTPCDHHDHLHILPAMIEKTERLLISCLFCSTIWFCDIHSGKFTQAMKKRGLYPGLMCKTDGSDLFIVHMVQGEKMMRKVKCTITEIIVDESKPINSKIENMFSACYLPDTKCLAISRWQDNVVKAVHCETGEQVWEVKGKVEGVTWYPHGLLFSPEHQSLLVCDAIDNLSRLVVLNPRDGHVLQIITLPTLGTPYFLYVQKGEIILQNMLTSRTEINVFRENPNFRPRFDTTF